MDVGLGAGLHHRESVSEGRGREILERLNADVVVAMQVGARPREGDPRERAACADADGNGGVFARRCDEPPHEHRDILVDEHLLSLRLRSPEGLKLERC